MTLVAAFSLRQAGAVFPAVPTECAGPLDDLVCGMSVATDQIDSSVNTLRMSRAPYAAHMVSLETFAIIFMRGWTHFLLTMEWKMIFYNHS
ncbi:MAG: hypothetical protein GYA47_09625 [Desulfovibrio sp.]|nr:hypothetical protein [Desulfovibrio sp.]